MTDKVDYDMEKSGFFDFLRGITDNKGASIHTMHDVCSYIYWAKESKIELKFNLTDAEYTRCLLSNQKDAYTEFYAYEELSALPAYQLMQEFQEFSQIVRGDLHWRKAKVFT